MNIKTNLLEEYVNFVDNTKKQDKYFKIFLFLIVIIMFLFLCFVLFKYRSILLYFIRLQVYEYVLLYNIK